MARTRQRSNYAGEVVRAKIIEFVEQYYIEHGVPPTIGDILNNVEETRSKSTIHYHLRTLVDEGKMRQTRSGATARFIPANFAVVRLPSDDHQDL